MVDDNILNWIKSKLSMGIQKEQIQNYLVQQGYSSNQISNIFFQIDNNSKNQIEAQTNSKFDLIFYLIGSFLFILLSFLFGKIQEGFIFILIYSGIYYVNSILFKKKSTYLKFSLIISNIIYLLYSLILIPQLLFPLIIANIFSIHYYLNTQRKHSYEKLNLIFLTTHFIITILLLLFIYILGITIFKIFDIIYSGYLFLFLSILIYISILLFFYISIFLIFKLFNEFDYNTYFKFNTIIIKVLNYFSTKEMNINKSIFKVSSIFFLIIFIPSVFLSISAGINFYNSSINQFENLHLGKLGDLEKDYYRDKYSSLSILKNITDLI